MIKYLAGVLALIALALAGMYFWIGVPEIYVQNIPDFPAPHFYNDPDRSLENISIRAVYFVPKNKAGSAPKDWNETLENSLNKLREFNALQFRGRSSIAYSIHPEPVIGNHNSLTYDTENTQRGNPRALINVAEELEERGLIGERPEGSYPVLFIMYEGVGASGGMINESELETEEEIAKELAIAEELIYILDVESVDGFFLVNRKILEDENVSIFEHEFYHTIGIPDAYEVKADVFDILRTHIASEDIMGEARFRPIGRAYISNKTLKQLGL